MPPPVYALLEKAIAARVTLFDSRQESAFRLFNGFSEGCRDLVIDIYGSTLVIHNYADDLAQGRLLVEEAQSFLANSLPWLRAGIVKSRDGKTQYPSSKSRAGEARGQLVFGEQPDLKIKEHGVWYALDLTINRDASLYLDTRNLRQWLIENIQGKSVLNTFAYTGSLGVAALAGRARRVVQVDRSRRFLNLAKESYTLNGFPIYRQDFIASDFFPAVGRFKRTGETFDCVIIDPPFFSITPKGRVDQENYSARLINKVRPLINDGGFLVAINNALYISGKEYMRTIESLCEDGYLKVRELIPIPQDFIGYNQVNAPITDPAPFNHSTKIAIFEVKRKQA